MDKIKTNEDREEKLKELEYEFVQDFIKLRKDNHLHTYLLQAIAHESNSMQ